MIGEDDLSSNLNKTSIDKVVKNVKKNDKKALPTEFKKHSKHHKNETISNYDLLIKWANSYNATINKIELKKHSDNNRYFIATKNIKV